jgi:hypothetical protein
MEAENPMSSANQRNESSRNGSFHDQAARDAYASLFRPIGIAAVLAGTRKPAVALDIRKKDLPGVLREDRQN